MQPCFTMSRWSVWISASLILAVFTACDEAPEFRSLDDGGQWKLESFGDNRQSLDSAELVFLNVHVVHPASGVALAEIEGKAFARDSSAVWKMLSTRFVGDSLLLVSSGPNFMINEAPGDTLHYHIAIKKMRTERQLTDTRLVELANLDTLVKSDTVRKNFTEYDGVWMRTLVKGDTAKVQEGREVVIQYLGRTLDGTVFDDSRKNEGALRFVMGHENQVIPGIELALERMHRRETAEVIIPSWLAFGRKGSGAGIVAPYTTVIYTVEVQELGL